VKTPVLAGLSVQFVLLGNAALVAVGNRRTHMMRALLDVATPPTIMLHGRYRSQTVEW
jgi:hypothetical protein